MTTADSLPEFASLTVEQTLKQAIARHQAGQLQEAERLYRGILQAQPNHPDANHNLGALAVQIRQPSAALPHFKTALEANPHHRQYWLSYLDALIQTGQIDAARHALTQGRQLGLNGEAVDALAVRLDEREQTAAQSNAENRHALKISLSVAPPISNNEQNPTPQETESLLSLIAEGRYTEAATLARTMTVRFPSHLFSWKALGVALKKTGQIAEALAAMQKAAALQSADAEAHTNLGVTFADLGRLTEAEGSFRRALEIEPNYVTALNNLGVALKNLGRPEEAAASYRRALQIRPNYLEAYANMLYLYAFTRIIPPEMECRLAANWENVFLSEIERTTARNRALLLNDSFAHSSRIGRKLRVGVVSAELGQHPVAEFLEPFLEQLDRSRFHVTLYSSLARPEPRADRFRMLADEFKPLTGISDARAAALIRDDRIDILIDTTAYLNGCRLGVFAHRAAPVQCHYIGYHGTTGLTEMDWFIADEVLLPPACDAHFREGIWRLPRLWISYRADASLPDSRWAPSPDGTVWLGSFNNLAKIREEALALWAKVMNAIPESRLLLKDSKSADSSTQKRIRMELNRHGVSSERVEFSGNLPDWRSHMVLYDRLDIALDTIPLNSGTTAFDALWMGVPLVALEGSWMGGRMTSTILKALKKPEWVAQTEDEYVEIVAALAGDVEGRKALRAAQRTLMAKSPLCDAKGLTSALEDSFEQMFDMWWRTRPATRSIDNRTGDLGY
jgi:predicted O-linked N-acetylglucosamine transferase (SPINDLY family)